MSKGYKIILDYTLSDKWEDIKNLKWTTAEVIDLLNNYFKKEEEKLTIAQQQISGSADASPILKTCENCHEYQAGCENYSGKVCERWVESF